MLPRAPPTVARNLLGRLRTNTTKPQAWSCRPRQWPCSSLRANSSVNGDLQSSTTTTTTTTPAATTDANFPGPTTPTPSSTKSNRPLNVEDEGNIDLEEKEEELRPCWQGLPPEMLPHVKRCDDEPTGVMNDTGFHVFFFGTGTSTSQRRFPSCTFLRLTGEGLLFDAGEGCQKQIKTSAAKLNKISRIFITHMHSDHVMGLPTLLLSSNIANMEEDTAVQVYGPPGIYNFLCANLALTHCRLKMMIEVYELVGGSARRKSFMGEMPQLRHPNILRRALPCGVDGVWNIKKFEEVTRESNSRAATDFQIRAAEVYHVPDVQTFGYVVEEKAPLPKLDMDLARKAGVEEGNKCSQLKLGFPVMSDDGTREVHPDEVTLPNPFIGRKLALLGDTCGIRPPMARLCRDADVLIHEATLSEEDISFAEQRGHSTASMAGRLAHFTNARLLILNHLGGTMSKETQEPNARALLGLPKAGNQRVITAFDFLEVMVPREGFKFSGFGKKKLSTGPSKLLPPFGLV